MMEYAMVHQSTGKEPFRAMVVDIGLGGAQLRTKECLPVGTVCTLELGTVSGKPLELQGEVRFSVPIPNSELYASGFRFLPQTHDERAAVAAYVHGVFAQQDEEEETA